VADATDREWFDRLPAGTLFWMPPGYDGLPGGHWCRPTLPGPGYDPPPGPGHVLMEIVGGGCGWVPLAVVRTWSRRLCGSASSLKQSMSDPAKVLGPEDLVGPDLEATLRRIADAFADNGKAAPLRRVAELVEAIADNVRCEGRLQEYQLRAEIRGLKESLADLLAAGSRLSNCCFNAAQAGGFKDAATGAKPHEVVETLRRTVAEWDAAERKADGLLAGGGSHTTEKGGGRGTQAG
jgi:hypothetical protein